MNSYKWERFARNGCQAFLTSPSPTVFPFPFPDSKRVSLENGFMQMRRSRREQAPILKASKLHNFEQMHPAQDTTSYSIQESSYTTLKRYSNTSMCRIQLANFVVASSCKFSTREQSPNLATREMTNLCWVVFSISVLLFQRWKHPFKSIWAVQDNAFQNIGRGTSWW